MGRSRSRSRDRRMSGDKDGRYRSDRDRGRDRDRDRDRSRDHRDRQRGHIPSSSRHRDSREWDSRRDNRKSSGGGRRDRDRGRSKSRSPKRHRKSASSSSTKDKRPDSARKNMPKRPLTAPVEGLGELVAKVEQEKIEQEKPVFLTKKQRQELALKKLEEKRKMEQQQFDADRKQREEFNRQAQEAHRQAQRDREKDSGYRSRDRERERRIRQESREEREKERKKQRQEESQRKEMQEIKDQYLVKKRKKKKVVPPSQKFKFSFDWEPADDTSQDLNPLYSSKHNVTLMYGRGYMAGVDRGLQRKENTIWDEVAKGDVIGDKGLMEEIEKKREEREKKESSKRKELALSNRHWKEKKLAEMTDRDWRIFKEDYNIATRGAALPNPIRFWHEADLPKQILDSLKKAGYDDATPIQRMGIPIGLDNRDVVGIAETGSGKTCAFLLPMLVYISKLPPMTQTSALDGPYAVILAPTRELAQQIEHECTKFAAGMGIRSVPIVGGISIEEQSFQLRDGAEILIATPGRLNDCLERRYIVLNQCNYIVLDEADRMMDMGFEPQVLSVMDAMPSTNLRPENPDEEEADHHYRQTIMFSATMPLKVEFLAKKYLRNPAFVAIGDRTGQTADKVKQNVVFCSDSQKRKKLVDMLIYSEPPIMVFMNNKKACDTLSKFLNNQGYNSTSLHGGKIQERRENALAGFKDGSIDVLICTNVAGRGIDVKGITHVINFDMPSTIEDYTHRIGRTGRAGMDGEATSFLTPADEDVMYDLKQLLLATGNHVPPELAKHPAAMSKPGTIGKKKKSNIVYAKK